MQELRNGGDQGIVDVVNSYLAIALSGGVVGLLLFVAPHLLTLLSMFAYLSRRRNDSDAATTAGRALFSILVGIMFMIYTVSSILAIPLLHWVITGLGLSYLGLIVKNENN